ncbi:Protein RMD5-like protein A [Triticum urartu]|uniref:Protein RMD5-like protein A n=2 Tax=Triticum urartu TaxID=4572 RepID=M7Z2S3_TRIUA|nr:protein RMD5 homolog isoform X1 [Triticum urartu]EMS46645.1 Protein RMD5-like protein A [Triticum urartu]
MEFDSLREAFDRVVEKRVLSSTKVQEVIDQIVDEVKQVISKMQMMDTDSMDSCDHSSMLAELKAKLNEMVPLNQLEGCQKELNVALSKYLKVLEKSFTTDISKAYRNVDFEASTVNNIIANHFYRQGLFDLGDSFVHECGESDETYLKLPFQEMYGILEAMKVRNLEPALTWAAKNHDQLLQNSSMLELKLHSLQFVEILTKGSRDVALQYARTHLVPFASLHKAEIQKLMACLIWADRLEQSPYAEFVSSTHWEKLAEELIHQFCSLLGQSSNSPLSVAISAGFQGLPTLLKLTTVMAAKKQEWQTMKQLPVPIDIGPEFQYHSVFVCPVLREQSSDENPPMLMPCGHAVSKQSIMKLSKSSSRPFKCPYCPSEAVASQCKQLHF